jgi:hypothetical protein
VSARAHPLPVPEPRRAGPRAAAAAVFLLAASALATPALATAATRAEPAICDRAGAQTEVALNLPPGLLRAIGRVESGRRDPVSGAFAPWPWTINAAGQGRFFADPESAAAAVRAHQAAGTANIDIGCFQVNLMHHPLAFRRIEDGFDPSANAAYAGAFLVSLRQRLGSWEAAVAAYHSATPERGEAYRARVFAAWGQAVPAPAAPAAHRAGPVVIRISGPDLSALDASIRVWTPSHPGSAAARVNMPPPPAGLVAVAGPGAGAGEPDAPDLQHP